MTEAQEIWAATKRTVDIAKYWSAGIEIGTAECGLCKEVTTVMSIDNSANEYGSFDCCKPCLDKLWENS